MNYIGTDIAKLPRRGNYIVESIKVAGWLMFFGAMSATVIQIVYGAWKLLQTQ